MINYFDAAEKTLRSRGTLEIALGNLERRKERIIRQSGPGGYPSIDYSKNYTSTKDVNDALSECLELSEVMREIVATKEAIEEIDNILSQMEPEDAELLRLWYVEKKSKEDIADAINYSSATTIYDLRNKAVSRFALLYFGASALSSI